MPLDPNATYRIINLRSERCIQRTIELGVLQGDLINRNDVTQLWRVRPLNDGSYLIISYNSCWALTHHGYFEGPITMSPLKEELSRWHKWKIQLPSEYFQMPLAQYHNDFLLLLTSNLLKDQKRNHQGQVNSCLGVLNEHKRPALLCEWPVNSADNLENQLFKFIIS